MDNNGWQSQNISSVPGNNKYYSQFKIKISLSLENSVKHVQVAQSLDAHPEIDQLQRKKYSEKRYIVLNMYSFCYGYCLSNAALPSCSMSIALGTLSHPLKVSDGQRSPSAGIILRYERHLKVSYFGICVWWWWSNPPGIPKQLLPFARLQIRLFLFRSHSSAAISLFCKGNSKPYLSGSQHS